MSLDLQPLDYYLAYQTHDLNYYHFKRALDRFPALSDRITLNGYWQGINECFQQYQAWNELHRNARGALQSLLRDGDLFYDDAYKRLLVKKKSAGLTEDEQTCLNQCERALEAESKLKQALKKLEEQQQAIFDHYQDLWQVLDAKINPLLDEITNSALKESVQQLMAIYRFRYDLDSYQRALKVLHVLEVYNQASQSFFESLESDFKLLETVPEMQQAHFGMDLNYRNLRRVHHLANTLQYSLSFIEVMCWITMFAAFTVMTISLSTLITLPLLVPALAFATVILAAGLFVACYLANNLIEHHKPHTYNPMDYHRERSCWFNKEGKVVEMHHLGDKEKARRQTLAGHRLFKCLSTFQTGESALVASIKDEVQALSEVFSHSNRIC